MNIEYSKGTYKFSVKGKEIEVFLSSTGNIEMYEIENPGKTGFFFNDLKELTVFSNYLCDIAENEHGKIQRCS